MNSQIVFLLLTPLTPYTARAVSPICNILGESTMEQGLDVVRCMGITPYAAGLFTIFNLPACAEQALIGTNTFALAE